VQFGLDGVHYEIDLSAKNASRFRKQLAPFIEHARRAGRRATGRPGRTAASRQRSGDIRAWAKDHGIAVSERGRIPTSVQQQYLAASKTTLTLDDLSRDGWHHRRCSERAMPGSRSHIVSAQPACGLSGLSADQAPARPVGATQIPG